MSGLGQFRRSVIRHKDQSRQNIGQQTQNGPFSSEDTQIVTGHLCADRHRIDHAGVIANNEQWAV
jgi:hypothetical protein